MDSTSWNAPVDERLSRVAAAVFRWTSPVPDQTDMLSLACLHYTLRAPLHTGDRIVNIATRQQSSLSLVCSNSRPEAHTEADGTRGGRA